MELCIKTSINVDNYGVVWQFILEVILPFISNVVASAKCTSPRIAPVESEDWAKRAQFIF